MWAGSARPQQDNTGLLATHSMPLQCSINLLPTHDGQLQCRVARHGGLTRRDNLHTVKDIICYTRQVANEYTRIQPPRGHLSGPGSHCTCHGLELLKAMQMLESLEQSQRLNSTLQYNFHSFVDVGYYATAARTT
jgi:hypothetical protein